MNLRALSFNATMFALTVIGLAACTAPSYTNVDVEKCLKAARIAASSNDQQTAEAQLLKAVDIATDSKGVPLVKALNVLSSYYKEQSKPERCSELLTKAKGVGDELLETNPQVADVSDFQIEYLTTIAALANWEREMGHFATAKRYYATAKSLNEKLGQSSPLKDTLDADYKKCVSEQETQESVESMVSSGKTVPRSRDGKNNSRRKFSLQYKTIMDGYGFRASRESEEMFVVLINQIRSDWGLDEPFYRVALAGLFEIVQRTGDFTYIERILEEDIRNMSALDKKTDSGVRLGPTEVVELEKFIDTLLWQARVAIAKLDVQSADRKATRALKLTEEYYPESGLKLEACWRALEEVHAQKGDYKLSAELAERAIEDSNQRDRKSSFFSQHFFDLGLSQLNLGQITQAVTTAESLLKQWAHNEPQRNSFKLTSLRIVFELECLIGDYVAASKTHVIISDFLNRNKRFGLVWQSALRYQSQRLLLDQGMFAEYVRLNADQTVDREHYYCQWLSHCDAMSYATLQADQAAKALEYCNNVENAKRDRFSDSLFYSKIVRTWLNVKESGKSLPKNPAQQQVLEMSVKRLIVCIDNLAYPNRLHAVKPLVVLANYLSESHTESAEMVYSCALSTYTKLPSRVDAPLIEALTGYHKLLVKQKRREEAWQINARLEQKKQKLSTLISIAKATLSRAKLL